MENIGISKSEFVTKTKFLSECLIVTFKLFGLEDFFKLFQLVLKFLPSKDNVRQLFNVMYKIFDLKQG